jgi:preprotein translocase subunit SecG
MKLFLTVVHVMTCIILVVVVLLQRGKGAEIGAVFGGGASSTVFGARGAGNFLTKLTTVAAVVFMVSSLTLSCLSTRELTPTLFQEESGAATTEPAPETDGATDSPFVEVEPPAAAGSDGADPGAPSP